MRRVMKRMVAREQVRQGVSNVQEGAIVDALARVIETTGIGQSRMQSDIDGEGDWADVRCPRLEAL